MFLTTPFTDLRLTTADLVLRPVDEAGLSTLVVVLPDDVELDPRATTYDGVGPHERRAAALRQTTWASAGTWSPADWALPFVVAAGGEVVGSQVLEGTDFRHTRTVDSASWLVPGARGRGWGVQARAAVLALAFGWLEAEYAVSSAWHDNHASLAVSRRLGYEPNGETIHHGGDRVDTMVHLRLRRARWVEDGAGDTVRVEGFAACRPYFGLQGRGPEDRAAGESTEEEQADLGRVRPGR
ncbi:GNAT family N-acetyltransferase [Segeticoccus rhizosphaerae]|uniref:GNAT family N-acetyltransferase n=1 Tax=Segeticoccus rhizosphaerae TaxID=1104777 RepID=UPI0010BFA95C|nr:MULTISPECIES: GNAT family protein [Intrasporangiaceae]